MYDVKSEPYLKDEQARPLFPDVLSFNDRRVKLMICGLENALDDADPSRKETVRRAINNAVVFQGHKLIHSQTYLPYTGWLGGTQRKYEAYLLHELECIIRESGFAEAIGLKQILSQPGFIEPENM